MKEYKTSKYKGVYWCGQDQRWRAYVYYDKRQRTLGNFKTEEDAHDARVEFEKKIHPPKIILNLPNELWRDFVFKEQPFAVSNKGRIKTFNYRNSGREELIKQQINPFGYYTVVLQRKLHFVHGLVAKYFIGDSELTVNHIDGDKLNNDVSNLEYISNRANVCHDLIRRDKLIGAHYRKRDGFWVSEIKIGNDRIWLGAYRTQIEAHESYMKALFRHGLIDDYNYITNLMKKGVEK